MFISVFLSLTLVSFGFVQAASDHSTITSIPSTQHEDVRLPTADYLKSQLEPTNKTAAWVHDFFEELYAAMFETRDFSVERCVKKITELQVRSVCFLFGGCLLRRPDVKAVTQHWLRAFIYPLTHIGVCAIQAFNGGVFFSEHFYVTEWWLNERCKAALYLVRHLAKHDLDNESLEQDRDFVALQEKLKKANLEPIQLCKACN